MGVGAGDEALRKWLRVIGDIKEFSALKGDFVICSTSSFCNHSAAE